MLALASACTWTQPTPAGDTATIELAATVPAGVSCLAVTLTDESGAARSMQAALRPSVPARFTNVRVGAYQVTAQAYAADDCANVPASPPWATLAPKLLVVMRGATNALTLDLFRVRPVVIGTDFRDNQVAVARDQGALGDIAASGNRLGWVVSGTAGKVMGFLDTDRAADAPFVAGQDQPSPGDVAVAADGRVFWTTPDSLRRFTPGRGAETLASGQRPAELAYAASGDTLFFDDFAGVRALAAGGPANQPARSIVDDAGAGTLALAHADQADYTVYWARFDDGAVRRFPRFGPVQTAATTGLVPPDDGIVGIAADDRAAYVSTRSNGDGSGAIFRIAADGSPAVTQIWPAPGMSPAAAARSIIVIGDDVYFAASAGVVRTRADGTGPIEILADGDVRGLAVARWGGHAWLYWTDRAFGGVVWRAQLPDVVPPVLPDHPIGVNIPDLLWAYLGITTTTTPAGMRGILDDARAAGVTHVRFVATPYWPIDMITGNGWVANPDAYWAAYDAMVRDVRARGLRLVPSILWNHWLFPDVAGEPAGALFTPGTRTRQLAEQYISELVARYRDSDTILMWEIGNELNLFADLDFSQCNVCTGGEAGDGCPNLVPVLGTPCLRTAADEFYSCNSCRGVSSAQQDLGQFVQSIAGLIRGLDGAHAVSSGYAYLRSVAYGLARSPCPACSNLTPDTEAEYRAMLDYLHPSNVSIVSVHNSAIPAPDFARFGSGDNSGADLLRRTSVAAAALGKQVLVGEISENNPGSVSCGGQTFVCKGDPGKGASRAVLDALVTSNVAYAAIWALEFRICNQLCLSVDGGDALMTEAARHNAAYGACAGLVDGAACPIGSCQAGTCAP